MGILKHSVRASLGIYSLTYSLMQELECLTSISHEAYTKATTDKLLHWSNKCSRGECHNTPPPPTMDPQLSDHMESISSRNTSCLVFQGSLKKVVNATRALWLRYDNPRLHMIPEFLAHGWASARAAGICLLGENT